MKATFNYTDRIDLDKQDFEASIVESENGRSINLKWTNLPISELAKTTLVVEVYASGEEHRFPIEMDFLKDSAVEIAIDNVRATIPRLRVKFIDTTHPALPLIRASIDNLRPIMSDEPGSIRSLLPIVKELGLEVAWQVRFEDNSEPILYICSQNDLADWLLTKPLFKAAIFPQIIEKIGEWLFTLSESESEEQVPLLWTRFFKNLGVSRPNEDDDSTSYLAEVREEAKSAAVAYSKRFNSLRELQAMMNNELESGL